MVFKKGDLEMEDDARYYQKMRYYMGNNSWKTVYFDRVTGKTFTTFDEPFVIEVAA